jgi:hypothetical protein
LSDPLFRSVHQALLFAYTFTPNQHAQAAAAERLIALFAKERYRDELELAPTLVRVESRGLIGLDGAAQAGMIQGAVLQLRPVLRASIEARFNILQRKQMLSARMVIVMHTCKACGRINPKRGQYLVQGAYGAHERLIDRREELYPEWSKATFYRRYWQVRQTVRQYEDQAIGMLGDRFVKEGLCEGV